MTTRELKNGVQIPLIMMGTSICDLSGDKKYLHDLLEKAIIHGLSSKKLGFDTGRDYDNEPLLGDIFSKLVNEGYCKREDIFITTKVGNGQQLSKDMKRELEISLNNLKMDYLDLWMLHWPFPDYYLDNWSQICDLYRTGKVKAIGFANCRERHLTAIKEAGLTMPMVAQVEYHPFRTINNFRKLCEKEGVQLEAYSANCLMLPFVRTNPVLNKLAEKYGKSVTQIIMRWHVQQGSIPIFRSFNLNHIDDNVHVDDFALTEEDMSEIFSLDMDYKFHPESINCPGY